MTTPSNSLTLSPDAAIDLQLHTINSDGTWTPEALIEYLVSENFALAAITDHDSAHTIAAVQQVAADKGFHLLAAVEMSTSWQGELTDILCYGFDPANNELDQLGRDLARRQRENTQEIFDNLQRQGYLSDQFPPDALTALLEKPSSQHLHQIVVLLQEYGTGFEPSALGKVLKAAGFDYIVTDINLIVEAAHRSGAVCILAHPGRGDGFTLFDDTRLDDLRQTVPIDGIEVYYPLHKSEQSARFLAYAQKHDLLTSSGSDLHGRDHLPIKYPAGLSRKLLKRLGIRIS